MEEKEKMVYAGVDMSNWDLDFKDDDENFIYKAFVVVCNYAEDKNSCNNCPLSRLCFSENGEKFWNKINERLND